MRTSWFTIIATKPKTEYCPMPHVINSAGQTVLLDGRVDATTVGKVAQFALQYFSDVHVFQGKSIGREVLPSDLERWQLTGQA